MDGFEDGTFWPKTMSREDYPYLQEMIDSDAPAEWTGNDPAPNPAPSPVHTPGAEPEGPFSGIRVLELADEKGQWCGKLLADMGADVVKIEPPGGQETRTVGPFFRDMPNRDRSLSFWHYNTSKRGITLSLETEDGRRLFRRLAAQADVVLETFRPGYMASLGLGYDDLKKDNPRLVMCSLTPFGQDGPWKDYETSDLLHLAAGGQMAGCGYTEEEEPDAPPIAPGGGQAWHMGSHFAMMATGAALLNRTVTGKRAVHRRLRPRGLRPDHRSGRDSLHLHGPDSAAADWPPRLSHSHGQEPAPVCRREIHQRRRADCEQAHLGEAADPRRLDEGRGTCRRHI